MAAAERLQKIIAAAGVASRRQAEKLIVAGRVKVNGAVVSELGAKADPGRDRIEVDGQLLSRQPGKRRYLLLHKPIGYLCTMADPDGRPIVSDLLPDVRERVYPVGRLDYLSEGLLLCTNDGQLAHRMMHPSFKLEKKYLVTVGGRIGKEQLARLERGIMLADGLARAAKARLLTAGARQSTVEIILRQGKNRQIRRMLAALDLEVRRLRRTHIGFLALEELEPGKYRDLRRQEIQRLRRLVGL